MIVSRSGYSRYNQIQTAVETGSSKTLVLDTEQW